MRTRTISDLVAHGLSSQRCPVTQQVMPNMVRSFEGFHVSYSRDSSNYGSDTTALVLQDRVFFVLNGYHADAMVEAGEQRGIQGCIDVFIERIQHANRLSEHRAAVGIVADPFNLASTALEMLGQETIDRIVKAASVEQVS